MKFSSLGRSLECGEPPTEMADFSVDAREKFF